MRSLLLALLAAASNCFAASFPASVASINPITGAVTVTPCASGRVPCQTFFDATAVVDSTFLTYSFYKARYKWYFGGLSGNWSYGQQTAKNKAQGIVAAALYDTAGTYAWTLYVYNGTNNGTDPDGAPYTAAYTGTNTFTDWPDDANTFVVANGTAAHGTGCGSNSTLVSSVSDLDVYINTTQSSNLTGKRLLFNKGDTFTADHTAIAGGAGGMIGACGSGAKPIFSDVTNSQTMLQFGGTGNAGTDLRISGIEMTGGGATSIAIGAGATTVNQITIHQVDCHDVAKCINIAASDLDVANSQGIANAAGASGQNRVTLSSITKSNFQIGQAIGVFSSQSQILVSTITAVGAANAYVDLADNLPSTLSSGTVQSWTLPFNPTYPLYSGIWCVECVFRDVVGGGSVGIPIFIDQQYGVLLGSHIYNATGGEHTVRLNKAMAATIVQNNTLADPADSKLALTIHSNEWAGTPTIAPNTYSQYGVVSDNTMTGSALGSGNTTMSLDPRNGTIDQRHRYWLVERNLFVHGAGTGTALSITSSNYDVVRNNIVDASAGNLHNGISIAGSSGTVSPASDHATILNNTFYSSGLTGNTIWITLAAGGTNALVENNIGYTLSSTGTRRSVADSSTGATCTNNSASVSGGSVGSCTGFLSSMATDPKFASATPSAPADFKVTAGSYAIGTGTNPYPAGNYTDWFGLAQPAASASTAGAACASGGC